VLISLLTSLGIVVMGKFYPSMLNQSTDIIRSIDFENVLMKMMLSFLLFAGAMHVDIHKLKKEIIPIISFATIGVLISTGCIAIIIFFLFKMFSFHIPFIYCLLFGALISPTDPIAVLGILRNANIPSSLEIKITGESLFNDGVGVVVFISIYEIALLGGNNISFLQITGLFIKEAGGGVLWGIN
jgi:CPA1 family monovalent cation:H+ antiporter